MFILYIHIYIYISIFFNFCHLWTRALILKGSNTLSRLSNNSSDITS